MAQGRMDYSSGIRDVAPPQLKRIKQTVSLTKAAKARLVWMDYYHTHNNNAALTARRFGISKSCFFKWKKRYDLHGVRGLSDQSKRPKVIRQPLTPIPVVSAIKTIRRLNPEFSKYKIQHIRSEERRV